MSIIKMKLLGLVVLIGSVSLWGQTEVSGNQSGTWDISGSPYIVTGDVTVPAGETLNIQAGVEVRASGHYKITVYGSIIASGTESQHILFTGNEATGEPWGGIEIINSSDTHEFENCRFENGMTYSNYNDVHGGAIFLKYSNASFEHCTFYHNMAIGDDDGMGGAVYGINLNNTTFRNCKFIDNYAFGSGGAVRLSAADNTVFENCVFLNNHCKYGGGAISFGGVSNTLLLRCLFAGNYTEYSSGGAIHTIGPVENVLVFQHCTLTENSAISGDGGAVELTYTNASFVNCIVWDNPGAYSDGIYLDMDGSAEINYSDLSMPDGATGSNNINLNPVFVNAGEGDYRLQSGSPCIDAGTTLGYEYYGSAPDMGCYEFGLTGINHATSSGIQVYPNPSAKHLYISGLQNPSEIVLFNASGQEVLREQDSSVIFVQTLNTGWYLLNIHSEQGIIHKKVYIE
jgi:predicted outer membrane repeat protein